MNFGIRWEPECLDDLKRICGNLETADAAVSDVDWRLSRNPLQGTWPLQRGSELRLVWVKDYLEFPSVYMSFEIITEGQNRYCLMKKARLANDPATS